jgi:hypothetical protein
VNNLVQIVVVVGIRTTQQYRQAEPFLMAG